MAQRRLGCGLVLLAHLVLGEPHAQDLIDVKRGDN